MDGWAVLPTSDVSIGIVTVSMTCTSSDRLLSSLAGILWWRAKEAYFRNIKVSNVMRRHFVLSFSASQLPKAREDFRRHTPSFTWIFLLSRKVLVVLSSAP